LTNRSRRAAKVRERRYADAGGVLARDEVVTSGSGLDHDASGLLRLCCAGLAVNA